MYRSTQGEGFLTGTESVFVRTSGCNLRCRFCDTPFASWQPGGETIAIDHLLDRLGHWNCRHIVLTGGEPMVFPALTPFSKLLREAGYQITIETAGTRYLSVACDLMSLSPKMSNSTPGEEQAPGWRERHDRWRHAPEVIRRLIDEHPYQVKFVVGSRGDCDEVEEYLEQIPEIRRDRVMLMPLGTEASDLQRVGQWLEAYCREHQLHFCPRRHIEWYGFRRGT